MNRRAGIGVGLCLLSAVAAADESDIYFAGMVSWQLQSVAGERQTLWLPWLVYDGAIFFDSAQLQAGARVWEQDAMRIDVIAQPRLGLEPGTDPGLAGVRRRRTTLEAGPRAQWKSAAWMGSVAYLHGIGANGDGSAVSAMLSRSLRLAAVEWIPSLEIRRESRALVHQQYGVSVEESRPSRPVYDGRATTVANVGLTAVYEKQARYVLVASAIEQFPGTGIRDSPIAQRSRATTLILAVGWFF